MKAPNVIVTVLLSLCLISCTENKVGDDADKPTRSQEARASLAACLTKQGWVMYGSNTCAACRAQRHVFGTAFSLITEIECNPHAADSQVKLCVEKKIIKFPTWLLEKNGASSKRAEGLHSLDDLASLSACRGTDSKQLDSSEAE